MKARRLLPLLGVAALLPASLDAGSYGTSHARDSGTCIGGSRCGYGNSVFEVALGFAPVEAIRFYAHDDVGHKYEGKLRIAIDGRPLVHRLDIKRAGQLHEIPAHGLSGRHLVFSAASNDEIVIQDVQVLYRESIPRGRHGGRAGQSSDRPYGSFHRSGSGGCFGGERCAGNTFEVQLSGAPIRALRFYAHDDVGRRHRAELAVRLDGRVIEWGLDIKKAGGSFELDLRGLRGRRLVFEALRHDEIVIEDIQVLYGDGRRAYRR